MNHLLITGATGNLGKELVKYFRGKNFGVLHLVGSKEKFENLIHDSELKYYFNYNLTDEDEVAKLFESISVNTEDELFIIHTVGGYAGGSYFWEYSKSDLIDMMNKNLVSSFLVAKYSAKKIQTIKGGSIVFISAKLSLDYEPKRSVYAISKSALNHLVKVIENEGKQINFTANAIAPKIILTDAAKSWIDQKDYDKYTSTDEISELIEKIFINYEKVSGNIFLVNDEN